jgi:hypothetical protein
MVCICPIVTLAAEKNKDNSKSALEQLKAVDKTSKDAAQDAKAGKLGSAKEKAGKGFDTPAPAASTGTVKNADTFKVKSQPVNVQDPKEISKRENEAQKIRDKEIAKKYKLDDPKKAPPKP